MSDTSTGFQPVAEAAPPTSGPEVGGPSPDDRNLAILAHLSAIATFVVPLGNVLGPLVVWLVTRERSPFLDDQGKEALNFQIGVAIVGVVLGAILMVGVVLSILIFPFVLVILAAAAFAVLFVFVVIVMIQAAMAVNKGEWYRYPVRMTFVK